MALAEGRDALGCTSAIVTASRSARGAAILWKHRDTGAPYNFIARHAPTDSTLEYIALHNQDDPAGLEAWIGMNRAGLAVMNTASYNLAPDTARYKDREGVIMTIALRHLTTVDQFGRLLDSLPRPLGVQANFGVIDAAGRAACFETCDTGYTRYDIAPGDPTFIRTNYSHSGSRNNRLGLAREAAARHFLDRAGGVTPQFLTDTLSASFYDAATGIDLLAGGDSTAIDRGDLIPRYISTASIAVEACTSPGGDGSCYVMWVRLGYPPAAATYRVTFDDIPIEVTPDTEGITPAERRADALKRQVYHLPRIDSRRVIDLRPLRHPKH